MLETQIDLAASNATESPGTIYSLIDESRLLLRLYSEVGTSNFWQGFVQELAGLACFSAGALALSRVDRWELIGVWTWNIDLESMGRYMTEEMAAQDELMAYVNNAEPQHFYSAGLYLTSSQAGSRYGHVYSNWIEPLGFDDVAIASAPSEHGNAAVALYRTREQGEFNRDELQHLDRLVPHIARALRLHSELVQQQSIGDLQGWLSLIKVPVLLFDENFRCRDQNAAARMLFSARDDMWLKDGILEFRDASATNRVSFEVIRTIKAGLGQLDSSMTRLTLELSGQPLNLFFMPVEDSGDSAVTSAGALVFIHQQSLLAGLDFRPLQSLFALTDAELAVCSRLAQGFSLNEIAKQEGKSRETVRTQIKHVFAKTGARSQAELVITLLTHPLVIGAIG